MASTLSLVPPDQLDDLVPELWVSFRKMACNSGGRWEPEDVIDHIRRGVMHLWLVRDGDELEAVALTEFHQYPRVKSLRFAACDGRNWRKWAHLRHEIIRWGVTNGARKIEAYAPRKWRHFFADMKEYHVMMELG